MQLTSSRTASTFSEVSSRLSAVAEHTTERKPAATQCNLSAPAAQLDCHRHQALPDTNKLQHPHAYQLCLYALVVLVVVLLRLGTVAHSEVCAETICLRSAEADCNLMLQTC